MNADSSTHASLCGLLPEELHTVLGLDTAFRARQVFKWIADGTRDFAGMTNLPAAVRERLTQTHTLFSTSVTQRLIDPDGTVKLQIALADGNMVETVLLMDTNERKTACVSCQAGCPMNCAFCQTGHIGFSRNLNAGEIVEQFFHLEDAVGKLDNIVFMGMGEPMLNLDAIRKAIVILAHPQGRNLSKRRITISTSGIVEGILDLARNGPAVRLAVSLTTANEPLRTSLMPVNLSNPLSQLKEAIRAYNEATGNRVTLEVALMHEVNTSERNADEIRDFAEGLSAHINLIPWNSVSALPFSTPSNNEVHRFMRLLEERKLNVTIRTKRGEKIGGACGQLGKTGS